MQAIDAYLRNVPPGYALLLSGPWGAGKSFFWTRYANALKEMRAVTISAAGLHTSTDLEDALFNASIAPLANSMLGETGAVIGKALLRVVKVDPSDIKFRADISPGKSVVCIDDVERFAGPFPALFGFIVNLLDASGVHCILIADENRAVANLKDYAIYKERIVGKTITVAPTIRDFCDQIIRGFSNPQSRRVLETGLDRLEGLIVAAKLSNLRTVRFFLTELEAVAREIPAEAADRLMSSTLPSAIFFYSAAIARSPDNARLVERAFKGDAGMVMSIARMGRNQDQNKISEDPSDDIGKLSILLDELGLADAAYEWPESHALTSLATGSEFNQSVLIADFGLCDADSTTIDDLEILRHHYKQSDSDVQSAITRLRATAAHGEPAVLMRLFQVFRTINHLAVNNITPFTSEDWTKEVLATLAKWRDHPELVESGALDIWPEHYSANEQQVIDAARAVSEAVNSLDQRRYREAAIQGLLTGTGHHPHDRVQVIFSEETDPEWLLSQLMIFGPPAIQRIYLHFRSHLRVSNAAQFVGVEAPFARALAERFQTEIEVRRPMPILDSELHVLARLLITFADKMDEDLAGTV